MRDFELPEEAEALAVPAQEGLWLEDQKDVLPVGEARCQEEEPEAIKGANPRLLHLALENYELLAEQGILCDQVSAREREGGGGAEEERRASRLSQMTEGLIQQRKEMGLEVEKERHAVEDSSRFC